MEEMKWNIESEYVDLNCKDFQTDIESTKKSKLELVNLIAEIENEKNNLEKIEALFLKITPASIISFNTINYVRCILSVDSQNEIANKIFSQLEALHLELSVQLSKADQIITHLNTDDFSQLCKKEKMKPYRFIFEQLRTQKAFLLSEKEEELVKTLSSSGPVAWSNLYNKLSGTLKCQVEYPNGQSETMGLSKAHSLLRGSDEGVRKSAWLAIQNAWQSHEVTAASILNHLAGWRIELAKKRSHTQGRHFLDRSLYENKLSKKTLDAMMASIEKHKTQLQKSAHLMAQTLGKDKLDPWDLLAPYPSGNHSNYTYEEAILTIKKSVEEVSPEMSSFIQMMVDKNWIEGRVLPSKRTGAFCTGFPKSRTPRIFMTYMGSSHDVSTLAHELGHAYHGWLMKELDINETHMPSTLAETASLFFETILRDTQIQKSKTPQEKLSHLWGEIESALGTIINISSRFEFEKNFYEERKNGELSAKELCSLMDQSWKKWYGDTLSVSDTYYWAHKLHFSLNKEFYNYPYTFGYLFALSIYERKDQLKGDFLNSYKNILLDTGRMTAEDLIQKHLGEDITKVEFWDQALEGVIKKINLYESIKKSMK